MEWKWSKYCRKWLIVAIFCWRGRGQVPFKESWGHLPWSVYARNTTGSICQYKEDGLVSRPPSLFTSVRRPMHGTSCPKSQLKSTCLTAKFGSFLDHAETGEKGQNVISSSVQHPISFDFCNPCFFYHTLSYQWCGYCWQGLCRNLWPQFVYIALSLDWKINWYFSLEIPIWLIFHKNHLILAYSWRKLPCWISHHDYVCVQTMLTVFYSIFDGKNLSPASKNFTIWYWSCYCVYGFRWISPPLGRSLE